jgi:cytochrome c5
MKRIAVVAGLVLLFGYAVWMGLARWPAPPPRKISFASQSITLPQSTETLPAGAHADVVTANCTSCHSAAMITTQPALKREQWEATVKKMREVYKAPIADADLPPIVDYLTALSGRVSAEAR